MPFATSLSLRILSLHPLQLRANMDISTALLLAIGTYIAWLALRLFQNYRLCLKTKLPIVISPAATLNPLWMIAQLVFPPVLSMLSNLPFGLGTWSKYTAIAWQFHDNHSAHDIYGPAFIVCTPANNELHVADPGALHAILAARKAFIKPPIMYQGLNAFGKNVDSVEGETWQRHSRITAPSLNERISGSVWAEGLRQAGDMLEFWVEKGAQGTRDTVADAAALTLNVFLHAGFGLQAAFRDPEGPVRAPHEMGYRDALRTVLENFTLLIMLPMSVLKWRILPAGMRKVGQACDEYKLYLKEMVEQQTLKADSVPKEQGSLLAALVQANQNAKGRNVLSEDELYGNLFVFNFAGHETTANTIATSLAYLAAEPQWQDWLNEEILAVTNGADPEDWDYKEIFPRLKRCQSVMYETLRRFPPAPFIPKAAAQPSQTLTINGTQHVIPGDTFVFLNAHGVHSDERVWGKDALRWRPDRWINGEISRGVGNEEMIETVPGGFIPWAEGPRACPGRKFSLVETTAALAILFRHHVVKPKCDDGEDEQSASKRVHKMIAGASITSLTLQISDPRAVSFVWNERQ